MLFFLKREVMLKQTFEKRGIPGFYCMAVFI